MLLCLAFGEVPLWFWALHDGAHMLQHVIGDDGVCLGGGMNCAAVEPGIGGL
jgi:hypothetical protein